MKVETESYRVDAYEDTFIKGTNAFIGAWKAS